MNIKLENIGIIKNSEIKLDGLTVITGNNNSGKTTVGKTIYSLVDSVSYLSIKADYDKFRYVINGLKDISATLSIFRKSKMISRDNDIFLPENPKLDFLVSNSPFEYRMILRKEETGEETVEEFLLKLKEELTKFDTEHFSANPYLRKYYTSFSIEKHSDDTFPVDMLSTQINMAIMQIKQMISVINGDPDLKNYTRESINQTLNVEFSGQIQPIKGNGEKSRIEVSDGNTLMFNLSINDNRIIDDGTPVFFDVPYKRAYFIDNPFVLDASSYRRADADKDIKQFDNTILDPERILPHENKLINVLKSAKKTTILEQSIINNGLKNIKKKMEEIISGDFEFTPDGEFYIKNGEKLHLTNLATGSKMFSILKILIDKGEIDHNTLLVLDEPEAHLHPGWQNKFAEIIVMLVKELGACILLTSHSPNFVLAIDAYMRKYDITDRTNFYQTSNLDDYYVEYKNVNNDMGLIYDDFMRYLSDVKILRDKYYNDIGE